MDNHMEENEPAVAQSRAEGATSNVGLCASVRLEIKRHIAPANLWHWAVIFGNGHIWEVSESFESAEICVADASGAGMDALHGAELATRRVHNDKVRRCPPQNKERRYDNTRR